MNILFLSKDYPPNHTGGVGIYVLEISRLLAKMGHKVYVITQAVEYPCKYIDSGVTVFRVKPKKLHFLDIIRNKLPGTVERLEYSFSAFKKIKEIVRKYDIDIVESSEARFEGLFYFLFNKKPKLVIKLHTPESVALKLDNVYPDFDYKVRLILEKWWIRRADRLVTLTQAVKDLTSRHYNLQLDGIPLTPNPIDIDFFKPGESKIATNGTPTVLYVGRLEFRKGVHVLMRAIPGVLKVIPEARFIFVGRDSGMKSYLINKINQTGYFNNISIVDGVPRYKLRDFYQNCTVCVLPSLWENHPYTCLEAMGCGKPVIATNIGGFPEIIENGVNGVLVDAGSSIKLADAIIRLLLNKNLCEDLGRNARGTMESDYNSKDVAGKTLSIYTQLLVE